MNTSNKLLMGIAVMAISFNAQAYPGESIALDPATGNYTITYRGNSSSTELSQTEFVPSTKIVPTIRSRFHMGERGTIIYRYTVSNGAGAKEGIVSVWLDQIVNPVVGELPFPSPPNKTKAAYDAYDTALKFAIATPAGWRGNIYRFPSDNLNRIAWSPNSLSTGAIPAGRILAGFSFSSLDLPGVGPARIGGVGGVMGFPDEGPLEDSAVFAELNRLRDNDFITRPAVVPMVSVPVPFNAAVLLDRIQTQTHTWIAMQLLDATFSSQLDRYLSAAADAYRHNQPKAGKEHIQTLRKMLKKEHEDADKDDDKEDGKHEGKSDDKNKRMQIDRLAARVLDFDLKYVLKRMGGDKDD